MELHNLKPAHGSVKTSHNRKGRGEATGNGGTAGRGHKGAKSRSGYSKKVGFEGGQMPLQRRVPKFGFTNPNRVEYKGVNLDLIQQLVNDGKITDNVDHALLVELGVIKSKDLVKILGRGKLDASINITAHKFTKTAKDSIESKGGKAVTL